MLLWANDAFDDLLGIQDYIAKDNPAAALRLAQKIVTKAEILDAHPKIGRIGALEGTREWYLPGTNYLLVYRIKSENVEIARVLHTSQQWPAKRSE